MPTLELEAAPTTRYTEWQQHSSRETSGGERVENRPARREGVVADRSNLPVEFEVASTVSEVMEGWGVVYKAYVETGLIDPNPYRLHTAPSAVGPDTAVVVGRAGGKAVSTASSIADGPQGLPLDCVYKEELDKLRAPGRRLVEIGLLADHHRGDDGGDSGSCVFDSTRIAFHFARYLGATDIVCGMHPRRSRLYTRIFGFTPVGTPRTYSCVKNHAVVLMHTTVEYVERNYSSHRALDYFMKNPVADEVFDRRYRFDAASLQSSPMGPYLRYLSH